jgi:hypothetical protein
VKQLELKKLGEEMVHSLPVPSAREGDLYEGGETVERNLYNNLAFHKYIAAPEQKRPPLRKASVNVSFVAFRLLQTSGNCCKSTVGLQLRLSRLGNPSAAATKHWYAKKM